MNARLDFLQELGNIGASHAATALSRMLDGKQLKLVAPQARMLEFAEAAEFINSSEDIVACIYMQMLAEIRGNIAFMLSKDSAINLLKILIGSHQEELDELARSALLEVGNIMLGSYLTALSLLTNTKIKPTVPVIAIDMRGAIWQSILAGANIVDTVTIIDTHFSTANTKLNGHIIFLPNDDIYKKTVSGFLRVSE